MLGDEDKVHKFAETLLEMREMLEEDLFKSKELQIIHVRNGRFQDRFGRIWKPRKTGKPGQRTYFTED